MDRLFRFISVRPLPEEAVSANLALSAESDFQNRLEAAASAENRRTQAVATARAFLDSAVSVARIADLNHGATLLELSERLTGTAAITPQSAAQAIASAFGEQAHSVWASASFRDDATRVRDTLIANYLLARAPAAGKDLTTAMRAIALIEAAAGSINQDATDAILKGPMILPEVLGQLRDPMPQPLLEPPLEERAHELAQELEGLYRQREKLRQIVHELSLHDIDELVVREGEEERPLGTLFLAEETEERRPIKTLGSSIIARAAARNNVFLAHAAIERLPEDAMQILRELDADPRRHALAEINQTLSNQLGTIKDQFLKKYNALSAVGMFEAIESELVTALFPVIEPVNDPETEGPAWSPAVPQLPTTYGTAKPLGIADLLLVKHQLLRYERGEVSFIENVLAGGRLSHTLRTAQSEEIAFTSESEEIDVRTEAQSVSHAESGRSQAVAEGYGPVAEGAGAQTFARDVTDQTASNLTSRMRRVTLRRTLREREDNTENLVDNAAGAGPRFGVYQWLDKVYQAQIFNYGRRLLYDVIVPEPAALFLRGMALGRTNGVPIARPAPFKLKPTDLGSLNWDYYVAGHQASGVEPPPASEIIVSVTFGGRASNQFKEDLNVGSFIIGEARTVQIPRGYSAFKCRLNCRSKLSPGGSARLRVTVGRRVFFDHNGVVENYLDGETETIPVSLLADTDAVAPGFSTLTVGIEIVCQATPELIGAWQSKAHTAILEANRRRFREYEERIANRDASLRLLLQNLAPDRKHAIILTELKRGALSVFTNQDFSGFNAMATDGFGFPHPSLFAVDQLSAYIRFFEQAIEWDHLSYLFYPYFWGRKKTWIEKLVSDEPDPGFAAFLQAGAARIILPVRRKYEAPLEQFMNTGLVPTTGELIEVGSKLYVALASELDEAPDGAEAPAGEPWEFRIPTALLRLRGDHALPMWALEQGEWKQKPDPAFL
jgi:hypothetical protein